MEERESWGRKLRKRKYVGIGAKKTNRKERSTEKSPELSNKKRERTVPFDSHTHTHTHTHVVCTSRGKGL